MKCPQCGKDWLDGFKFCPECGVPFSADAPGADSESRMPTVQTGGGAFLGGNAIVHDGGFVGRDQHNTYNITEQTPPDELLKAYYLSLAAECRALPLGIVDPRFAQPGGKGEVALHEVYVDLDVVAPVREEGEDPHAWGLRLSRGDEGERTPLLDALGRPEAAKVVLLGDPGSGKTTFVNYLTYWLAEEAAGEAAGGAAIPEAFRQRCPVRLVLRDVAAHLPVDTACGAAELLWEALYADLCTRLGKPAAERLWPYLQQEHLLRRGGIFLLDGLDEVPEAGRRRRCLLEAVHKLTTCLPAGSRVILTARPYAYADPKWQLPDFQTLALAPFNAEQIAHFVDRWYQAVRPAVGCDAATAEERGKRLAQALQERAYLADLASRPLLLTLMATLHTSWGQLPEDRADLYEESVKLLLARWQRSREVQGADGQPLLEPGIARALGIGESKIRAALERLAFETHVRQGSREGREEAPADILLAEVLAAFTPLLPDDVNPTVLLTYLETRAGLLLCRREGVYAFPHRSFQEYLSACHLANTDPEFAERLRLLIWEDSAWWREVFLLGVGKKRQGGLGDAVNIVNTLVPASPAETRKITETHWRAATIAAQALVELRLQEEAVGRPPFEATLERIRRWLVALIEGGQLPAKERAAAGDLLGTLGDPRPGVGVLPEQKEMPDILWVEVPAGPFLMGSRKDEPEIYTDETPQHTLALPEFYLGRYPVTNAQYRPFVEGDGYTNPAYWTEEGWAWRQGADPDLSSLDDLTDEDVKKRYAAHLAKRTPEKRNAPFWWYEFDEWLGPNRPVIGVCWYEAAAYARWLTVQMRTQSQVLRIWRDGHIEELRPGAFEIRLPSEAEWEKAARGTGGPRWPWGDSWKEDHANTEEAGLKQTGAVGLFPEGVSPYGALDMIGNVWEWTRSRWGTKYGSPDYRYPYDPDDGRESPEGPAVPVLRGGSWNYGQRNARCAFRYRFLPANVDLDLGFRLGVVSLENADF